MANVGSEWLQKVMSQQGLQLAGLGILVARLGVVVTMYREIK